MQNIPVIRTLKDIPKGARVFIYGAGMGGQAILLKLRKLRLDVSMKGYIDSYKKGRCLGEVVLSPEKFAETIAATEYDLILIASVHKDAIAAGLEKKGIIKYAIVVHPGPILYHMIPQVCSAYVSERCVRFIFALLSVVIPRKKETIVIVGEYGGKFCCNTKYLYLYLTHETDADVRWLASDPEWHKKLCKNGIRSMLYGKWKTLFLLLRASWVVVNNTEWIRRLPLVRYVPAKRLQLWHGVGFKTVGWLREPEYLAAGLSVQEEKRFQRQYDRDDVFVTTSPFYAKEVFMPGFLLKEKNIAIAGYPRNDIFYRKIKGSTLGFSPEFVEEVARLKQGRVKVIVYTPTFRDMRTDFNFDTLLDYKELHDFLEAHNMVCVVKGHSDDKYTYCLLYTSPSPRDGLLSRMPSSA